jgi:hypothetical protein
MSDDKFETDLDALVTRLVSERNGPVFAKLDLIRAKLLEMRRKHLVRINHSVMELVCASARITLQNSIHRRIYSTYMRMRNVAS